MTRLERLLSMALVLSARRRLRAQELAEEFGVTLRTVYRDVRALQQAGFPVVGTAGDGYRIPPASQLRPLAFEPGEAEVLVMGARLLDVIVDAPLKDRLLSAISKLEAILSPTAIQRVQEQRDRVVIEPRWGPTGPLATLLEAVNARRVVTIAYDGLARGERTHRAIEPIGLVRYANVWLVPAYCRLREDLRVFRADRVVDAQLTPETFNPRPGLTLTDYIRMCEREEAASPPDRPLSPAQGTLPVVQARNHQPEGTMNAHSQTVTIQANPKVVFDFVANIENLPKWAVVFCQRLRREGSRWIVTTPGGELALRYATDPKAGIIDMYVSPAPGVEGAAYSRVIPNGEGTEYVFTFFQTPDISDEDFARQGAALQKELGVLKGLLERRS